MINPEGMECGGRIRAKATRSGDRNRRKMVMDLFVAFYIDELMPNYKEEDFS
jgi:hypothetical protein